MRPGSLLRPDGVTPGAFRTPARLALAIIPLCLAGFAREAAAARPPGVQGAYYGTFTSTRGDVTAAGLVLSSQSGRRLLGWVEANMFMPMTELRGSVSGSGRITLSGRGRSPRGAVRLSVTGTFVMDEDGRIGTLTGNFRTTGAARSRGTFTLRGFLPQ